MRTAFVEATQSVEGGLNWGKFMVGLFDAEEWARSPSLPGATWQTSLLGGRGWTREHVLVCDLQTGEGAMFLPGGMPSADLHKHKIWVCPMFEPFLVWLYAHVKEHENTVVKHRSVGPTSFFAAPGWFELLPPLVELPDAEPAQYGYRRDGGAALAGRVARDAKRKILGALELIGKGEVAEFGQIPGLLPGLHDDFDVIERAIVPSDT